MFQLAAKQAIEEELQKAQQARAAGLEGRARVCARRAAGIAVREWSQQPGRTLPRQSAYDNLAWLETHAQAPQEAREMAALLRERVNENFDLPSQVDLIEAARKLVSILESSNPAQ